MDKRKCELCGAEFEPVRKHHRFCSKAHRIEFNNKKKQAGVHIHPDIYERICDVANGQEKSAELLVNVALDKAFPRPMPMTEDQINGTDR